MILHFPNQLVLLPIFTCLDDSPHPSQQGGGHRGTTSRLPLHFRPASRLPVPFLPSLPPPTTNFALPPASHYHFHPCHRRTSQGAGGRWLQLPQQKDQVFRTFSTLLFEKNGYYRAAMTSAPPKKKSDPVR